MGTTFKLLELLLRQKLLGQGLKGDPYTPLIVSYAVTRACNLRCLHCHVSAREALPDELNLKEAIHTIDEMHSLGTQAVIFSGGEPLLRKNFVLQLIEHCDDLGIIPAMLSNGLLMTPQTVLELQEAGLKAVGLPIDSVVPEKHDHLRNVPGTFNKTVQAIKTCLELDLEVVITTMALKDTYTEMPKRIEYLNGLGVDEVAVYDLVPVGRGKDVMDNAMTMDQRVNLIKWLQRQQEDTEMTFTMSGGTPLYPEIACEMHHNHGTKAKDLLIKEFWIHNGIGCHAGNMYFSLRPNGDIYPCTFLPIKVGNIRNQSLREIWQKAPLLNALRQRQNLKGKCGSCEYREGCGGCRGRAYACTGDYLETDPVCLRDLLIEEKISPADIKRFGWCVG
ncbi:MAG: radical SAM protein [Methanocella sp.]|jgi:radical SAM protein with 4Fe4S-binding SPASM domain